MRRRGTARKVKSSRRGRRSAPDGYCFLCSAPLDGRRVYAVKGTLQRGQDCSDRIGDLVEIDLCGFPFPALAVPPDSPVGREGAQLMFLLCSDSCVKTLCLAALLGRSMAGEDPPDEARPGWANGLTLMPKPGADSAARERESLEPDDRFARVFAELERLGLHAPLGLDNCCAWCFRTFAEDEPVHTVHVNLNSDPDPSDREGHMLSISIGGRPVPGRVPEVGSAASLCGQLFFVVCPHPCAGELHAAITEDIRLSVVH